LGGAQRLLEIKMGEASEDGCLTKSATRRSSTPGTAAKRGAGAPWAGRWRG
jgi:hypothetical protein